MERTTDFQVLLGQIKAMVPQSFPTNSWYIIVVGTSNTDRPARKTTNDNISRLQIC